MNRLKWHHRRVELTLASSQSINNYTVHSPVIFRLWFRVFDPKKSSKGEKSLGVTLEWPYSSTRLSTSQGFHLSEPATLNFRISSLRQEELNHFQDPSSIPTDLYHYSLTPWWRQLGKCFLSYISQPVFITKDRVDSNTGYQAYHCFCSTGILSLTMISPINPTPFVFVHWIMRFPRNTIITYLPTFSSGRRQSLIWNSANIIVADGHSSQFHDNDRPVFTLLESHFDRKLHELAKNWKW